MSRSSPNAEVLGIYSERAKQYGLTLDEFLDEVKHGSIRVFRNGPEISFERDEPLFGLTSHVDPMKTTDRRKRRDYPD